MTDRLSRATSAPGPFTLLATRVKQPSKPKRGGFVQFLSFFVALAVLFAAGLAIGLAIVMGEPVLAIPLFLVFVGAFLLWRGKRRAEEQFATRFASEMSPAATTAGTTADPAQESSAADVNRSTADRQTPGGAQSRA
jgi:hypothetical protein